MRITRLKSAIALAVVVAGVVGCGGSQDTESTGTAGTASSAAVADAAKVIRQASQLPTKLTVADPLPARPKGGENVYYIACGIPVCDQIFAGIKAGSEALGWKATKINIDQSNPATINSGVQQAIDNGATIIVQTGNQVASFQSALRAAQQKGILFLDGNTDNPQGDNGIATRVAPTEVMLPKYGELVGNLIASDSKGAANVGLVRIKAYDNIVQPGFDAVRRTLAARCPGTCKVDDVVIGIQDLFNRQLPSRVVSYLQSHPDVDYLVFGIGAMETGVIPALREAGLDDVKTTGFFPEPSQQAEIAGGDSLPWPGAPLGVEGWQFVDAAARVRQHMDLKGYDQLGIPVWLVTKENLRSPTVYENAPDGYAEQFKRLWGLGG